MSLMQSARDETTKLGGELYNYGTYAADNAASAWNNWSNSAATTANEATTAWNEGSTSVSTWFGGITTSSTLTSKLVFFVCVAIVLYLVIYLTIFAIGYFRLTSSAPWLISGTLPGSVAVTITQHPYSNPSQFIARSSDDPHGMSFTYSWWMQVHNQKTSSANTVYPVFVKGSLAATGGSIATLNGPGVYVVAADSRLALRVVMDAEASGTYESRTQVDVQRIPAKKWFHVALRLQNTALDVYVNGTAVKRVIFDTVPHQNDLDMFVCPQGGFAGSLADLRYFPSALSIWSINAIVFAGPNTYASSYAPQASVRGSDTDFISYFWYQNQDQLQ